MGNLFDNIGDLMHIRQHMFSGLSERRILARLLQLSFLSLQNMPWELSVTIGVLLEKGNCLNITWYNQRMVPLRRCYLLPCYWYVPWFKCQWGKMQSPVGSLCFLKFRSTHEIEAKSIKYGDAHTFIFVCSTKIGKFLFQVIEPSKWSFSLKSQMNV